MAQKRRRKFLEKEALSSGEIIQLNQEKLPGCFFHRSAKDDVARTEHLTFICAKKKQTAGPNNNWMSPRAGYAKAKAIFKGAMKAGRCMLFLFPWGRWVRLLAR